MLRRATGGNVRTNLGLGGGTDTGHGKSDVDSRANTLEEELGLEEDLSIAVRGESESDQLRRRGAKKTRREKSTYVIEITLVGLDETESAGHSHGEDNEEERTCRPRHLHPGSR